MSLQKQIREDMVNAMKTKNRDTLDLLRVVAGEFGREMKDARKELSDDEAMKVIRKMSDNAKELGNLGEVEILDKYLPSMLSEAQIRVAVNSIIQEMGYSTMKDMGAVMKDIKKLGTASQIDGKIASKITREILSQ